MHKRGATFLAPTAFAIADSPLSLSPNGCLPVHSPLNFLSSFLMRALMHMRGSRCFYSKLAAIALSYFFNAPRALISRPPNCENFQTTAGRPKVHSQPFHLWTSPCVWLLRGRLPSRPETCRSVWGISHIGPKVSCFSTESHGKQQSFWNLRCTAKLPFECIFCFMV